MSDIKEYNCDDDSFKNIRLQDSIPDYYCRDKGDNGKTYERTGGCYKWDRKALNWVRGGLDPQTVKCEDGIYVKGLQNSHSDERNFLDTLETKTKKQIFKCKCNSQYQDTVVQVYDPDFGASWRETSGKDAPSVAPDPPVLDVRKW